MTNKFSIDDERCVTKVAPLEHRLLSAKGFGYFQLSQNYFPLNVVSAFEDSFSI